MTTQEDDRIAVLALRRAPGATNRSVEALKTAHGGSLAAAARAALAPPALERAAADLRRLEDDAVEVLLKGDPRYPALLLEEPDAPLALYVKGRLDERDDPAIAIVGSRRATPEGRRIARALAEGFAGMTATVVSGLARGVDGEAHRGALDAGGRTIAVLGSGIDVVYPAEHRGLAARAAAAGAVLSELPPGTGPLPWNFPARNRILAGLARAVVVVEAAERSGSLITAHLAAEMGRAVLAVPGSPLAETHRGTNRLIQEGARLLQSIEDVVDELPRALRSRLRIAPLPEPEAALSGSAEDVRGALDFHEPRALDAIALCSGRSAGEASAALLALELEGRVERLPGARWVAVPSRAPLRGARSLGRAAARDTVLSSGKDLSNGA